MGLPHVTLDVRAGFRAEVVDDFLEELGAGRTPNPCVRCNGHVRFDAMLDLAQKLGAKRLATGHYARVVEPGDGGGPLIAAAADPAKDQAYMLARLRPEELHRIWFPLGGLRKPQVRELARAAGLPVAERPESQDLCFLSGTSAEQFAARHGVHAQPGAILDAEGRTLGEHDGQHRFTVGQRRGIGVAAREPLYVVAKDAESGAVTVGPKSALSTRTVSVAGAMLYRDATEVDRVKLRYRSAPVRCRVVPAAAAAGRHRALEIELAEPVDGVAPGQTACLMRGDSVIGFATIAPSARRPTTPTPKRELSYAR
jgi:tRNA-specific 2-thiouridylase